MDEYSAKVLGIGIGCLALGVFWPGYACIGVAVLLVAGIMFASGY